MMYVLQINFTFKFKSVIINLMIINNYQYCIKIQILITFIYIFPSKYYNLKGK